MNEHGTPLPPRPPRTRRRKNTTLALYGMSIVSGIVAVSLLAGSMIAPSAGNLQAAGTATGSITGTVWRDHSFDGSRSSLEPGMAGIEVAAYDDDGDLVGTAVSGSDGSYTLNIAAANDNQAIRVEFNIPATITYLQDGPLGADNGSAVQFATIGATGVDFAVVNPADYTLADPDLAVAVFRNGPIAGQFDENPNPGDAVNTDMALARFPWTYDEASQLSADDPFSLATNGEIGSVYGLAYNNADEVMYASAYVKRHVGMGQGGVSAIYTIDPNTGAISQLGHDVNTDPSGLFPAVRDNLCLAGSPDPSACPSYDDEVLGLVGKIGWGDIEMSEDMSTLWGANLGTREIVAMPIDNPANETSYGQPADLVCASGIARPFAVTPHDGLIYTGWVCTGELLPPANGGADTELTAHVYALDPATGTWSASLLDIPLNYDRYQAWDPNNARGLGDGWEPWVDTWSANGTDLFHEDQWSLVWRPQPMLADIAFDWDGSMALGFRDRGADQLGTFNYIPVEGSTKIIEGIQAGDLLRAAWDGTQFVLESGGVAGGDTGAKTGTLDGPGGGEYYNDDWSDGGAWHPETPMGALLLYPGLQDLGHTQLVAAEMDPINGRFNAAGVSWYDNTTGEVEQAWEMYGFANRTQTVMGKSNGLGDLVALTVPAPVEIGNRLWHDADGDGIQDPSEAPLAGVVVELYAAGAVPGVDAPIATATTDADGNYLFSSNLEQTSTGSFIYGIDGFVEGAEFQIVVPTTATLPSGEIVVLTAVDAASSIGDGADDSRDSDADPATGITATNVVIGAAGENDHTWDFGYSSATYDLALILTHDATGPVAPGDTVIWTVDVANQGIAPAGDFTVVQQLPAGVDFVSASDGGIYDPVTHTVTWTIADLAPGAVDSLTVETVTSTDPTDIALGDFRSWAEITADSAADYGVTDEDSTPDSDTGSDNEAGVGTDPNDAYVNHNDISLDEPAGDEDDNDFEIVEVHVSYDLALVLTTGTTGQIEPGDEVVWDVTVKNQGNVDSGEFTVVDQLPDGMEFESATDGGVYDPDTHTVTWTVANLAPGETFAPSITTTLVDPTFEDYINWAEITEDSAQEMYGVNDDDSTTDANIGDNGTFPNDDFVDAGLADIDVDVREGDEDDNDSAQLSVNINYDLALVITRDEGIPVMVGGNVVYTIEVANQGNVDSGEVTIRDLLPEGTTFSSTTNGGVLVDSSTVEWTLANLAPGEIVTIKLTVILTDGSKGTYETVAEIVADSAAMYGTTDEDSTPDTNLSNDAFVDHDNISADTVPGDEDDHDAATFDVNTIAQPQPKPKTGSNAAPLAAGAGALMMAGLGLFGFGAFRRRRRQAASAT